MRDLWFAYLVVLQEPCARKASGAHGSGNWRLGCGTRGAGVYPFCAAGGAGKLPRLMNPMPRIALQMTQGK